MTTIRITQADIDLAKLYLRAAEKLDRPVKPEYRALAAAQPTPAVDRASSDHI